MPINRQSQFNDETQTIISSMPQNSAIWAGTVVLGFWLILLVIACFLHYPQTLKVMAAVNTYKINSTILVKSDVTIDTLLVKEGVLVKEGQVLAVFKNTANWQQIEMAYATVKNLKFKSSFTPNYSLKLGELTPQYLDFVAAWKTAKASGDELIFQKAYYGFLKNYETWSNQFLLKATQTGQINWEKVAYSGNSIIAGTPLLTIDSENTEGGICQVLIPDMYINQVKTGQTTLVEWNNQAVPLRGTISEIAKVPTDKGYWASVDFDQTDTFLSESPPTKVVAELVLEDTRLIEHLFQPLKLMFDKQRQARAAEAQKTETVKTVKYTGN